MNPLKFLWIIFGVAIVSASGLASCSDDKLNDGDELTSLVVWSETHPYGIMFKPTVCTNGSIGVTGSLSFDDNANSYILTPNSVAGISVKKLKPFASVPILVPDSILSTSLHTSGEMTIAIENNSMIEEIINGISYQKVRFFADSPVVASRSSNNEVINICGTPNISSLPPIQNYTLSRSNYTTTKYVGVYYHAVRSTNGAGITDKDSRALTIMHQLSSYYANTNIEFVLFGTEYNDCVSNWLSTNLNSLMFLFSTNVHADGVDIFEVSQPITDGMGLLVMGYAESIGGGALIVAPGASRYETTVAHEMGHCLGLWHTHHGAPGVEGGVAEFVDGSNSLVAGDSIVDTPADPCKWGSSTGSYIGNVLDPKGIPYNPDHTLIMSYSKLSNRFSDLQINRMHYYLENSLTHLQYRVAVTDLPSTHFVSSVTLQVKHPIDGFTASWNIKRYTPSAVEDQDPVLNETTQSGNSCTITTSTNDYFEVNVTYSNGISSSTAKCRMTANAPSPNTGTLAWSASNGSYGFTTNKNHGEPLSIGNNDLTIQLEYRDMLDAKINGIGYRLVTATNRVLNGPIMTINKADCTRGFLKLRLSDASGISGEYFTIPVTIIGGYYAMNVDTASDRITLSSEAGASPAGKTAAKAKAPAIGTIIIYDSNGKTVATLNGNAASTANISTAGWAKGEYRAEVSDGADYNQTILFAL